MSEIREACYSGHLVQLFVRVLREVNSVPRDFLAELSALGVRARIPIGQAHELLRAAVEVSGDQDLGLKAAQLADFGYFGTLEYAAGTAPTWRDTIGTIVHLAPLVNEAAEFRLQVDGSRAALILTTKTPLSRTAGDFCTAAIWRTVTLWLDREEIPAEVCFAHPAPHERSNYEAVFKGANLVFDAADYAIIVNSANLLRPNSHHDPHLHAILLDHGERLLAELPRVESLTERVRRCIVETMPDGSVSAERVASMLSMSRRTLSRQLGVEDTSFRELLEEVRQRFAKHYLESSNLGAADIAFMLGFSQSAAFVRAFRRWTGYAPGEYRRRLRP